MGVVGQGEVRNKKKSIVNNGVPYKKPVKNKRGRTVIIHFG